ncbi:hypothetical protein R3X26_10550 [Vibrio sp. TH_r3]|uniref:hypothetical protein n=1 Tax=Vibrio sp. TH_r3 TaxID=3082084 RepID=UPI002954888B|nr:hypothetical protein [Vibrio sp. TH_r3]MDV7104838.1 hypothetical protein [Vibrio sp. TH_r3]
MKLPPILFLVLAITLGFYAPDIVKSLKNKTEPFDIAQYCMLSSKSCEQNKVSMTLEQDIAKPLVPNTIEVIWENTLSDTLLLSLQGVEMDMGIAKYQLTKQPNGKFSTDIMLPVCTENKMTWIGTLTDGKKQVYAAIRMER